MKPATQLRQYPQHCQTPVAPAASKVHTQVADVAEEIPYEQVAAVEHTSGLTVQLPQGLGRVVHVLESQDGPGLQRPQC